jgi:hypothetical protein
MVYNNLVDFLIRAKKATYAGKGIETIPSRPNSHDFEYKENDLKYIDTYIGGLSFSGEEAVWKENKPIWSMNYFGRVIEDGFDGDFLKEALLKVSKDNPYRGLDGYKRDDYKYICNVDGSFEWFKGFEEIYKENIKIYECRFHGGILK